ncbi:MAG: DUF1501 domain-containing protein [Acidobacteriia bacterium]|nr:DUF1501 domain-containing protein [Terriglobia bacterium]
MSHHDQKKCECKKYHGRNSFWDGPGLSRRQFFKIAGTAVTGYYFLPIGRPLEIRAQTPSVSLQNTARNCIYIHLDGAPSHVDTFDLKEGSWTPSDFAPTSFGSIRFPQGLMPNLATQLHRITLVRSVRAWALIHSLGQVWKQIARNPAAALGKIAPNIGSVVAYEFDKHRTAGQLLPAFISLNSANLVGPGYFPAQYANFDVTPSANGLANVTHPDGQSRFNTRWSLLHTLDNPLRENSPLGRPPEDMDQFYTSAKGLMYNSVINSIFSFTAAEHTQYGSSSFGDACITARNVVKSNQGSHFVTLNFGGWDHHQNIYAKPNGIYGRAAQFDPGLAALLSDLAALPGFSNGKSLLDETLVVAGGEFGRTVGALNNQSGRDHFLQQSVLFAGGGVRGGVALGSTDPQGAATLDPGWSQGRDIKPEDIAATIYSALGIDYTTELFNDPLKRGFEYVPFAKDGLYAPINELFA